MSRSFYLVQRIKRSRRADMEPSEVASKLAKLSDAFGYGHMGDYDLDYMGSAEFEWGAIPKAFDRFKDAGKDGLVLTEWTYNGHVLDFLYIAKDGEPFEEWARWAEGRPIDEYTGREHKESPFYGKERPYELEQRLNGEQPPSYSDGEWRTDVYWALTEGVMWAFHEDGHLHKMLESMGQTKSVSLRG